MLNNEAEKYDQNDDSSEDNLILRYKSQEAENKLRIEHTVRLGTINSTGAGYEYVKYNNRTFNRIFIFRRCCRRSITSRSSHEQIRLFAQGSRKLADEPPRPFPGLPDGRQQLLEEMNNPWSSSPLVFLWLMPLLSACLSTSTRAFTINSRPIPSWAIRKTAFLSTSKWDKIRPEQSPGGGAGIQHGGELPVYGGRILQILQRLPLSAAGQPDAVLTWAATSAWWATSRLCQRSDGRSYGLEVALSAAPVQGFLRHCRLYAGLERIRR